MPPAPPPPPPPRPRLRICSDCKVNPYGKPRRLGHVNPKEPRPLSESTKLGPAALRYLLMGGRQRFQEQGMTPRLEHPFFHVSHDEV